VPGPEATIERKCREAAKARGCSLYKISFRGRVGCPDRMLIAPPARPRSRRAVVVFVEFKRLGETASAHQEIVHEEMRAAGLVVWVIDSVDCFESALRTLLRDNAQTD